MSTPWGRAQTARVIADGIGEVTTAGHGGILLSAERQQHIPAAVRHRDRWYEEDCEWAIVAMVFPEPFRAEQIQFGKSEEEGDRYIEKVREVVINTYPDAYEAITGETVSPEQSRTLREEQFYRNQAQSWVAVSAIRSDTYKGMTQVTAIIGGDRSKIHTDDAQVFLVPSDEYQGNRDGLPFVVDPDRYQRMPDAA